MVFDFTFFYNLWYKYQKVSYEKNKLTYSWIIFNIRLALSSYSILKIKSKKTSFNSLINTGDSSTPNTQIMIAPMKSIMKHSIYRKKQSPSIPLLSKSIPYMLRRLVMPTTMSVIMMKYTQYQYVYLNKNRSNSLHWIV